MSLASRIVGFFTPKKRSREEDVENNGGKRGRVLFDKLPKGAAGHSKPLDSEDAHSKSTLDPTTQNGKTLLERGDFTLNFFTEEFAQTALHAAGSYLEPEEIRGRTGLNLTAPVKEGFTQPRICEATVSLECKIRSGAEVPQCPEKQGGVDRNCRTSGDPAVRVHIAEVTGVHISDTILTETADGQSMLDFDKYRPVSHMGGHVYSRIHQTFQLTPFKGAGPESFPAPKGAKQANIPEEALQSEALVEADAPEQPATPEEADNAKNDEEDAPALAVASDIDATALEALKNALPSDVEVPEPGN